MCDAACIKHILNSGFMATLAPLVAGPEASALAEAARVHSDMLATLGYAAAPDKLATFDGCEQAKLLVQWIREEVIPGGGLTDRAEKMNKWTAELWKQIADLAAGKLPS